MGQICSQLKVLKNQVEELHISGTLNRNVGTFYTFEKPEKSSKPDTEKPGLPEARYIKARACPEPEKSRPGTLLVAAAIKQVEVLCDCLLLSSVDDRSKASFGATTGR